MFKFVQKNKFLFKGFLGLFVFVEIFGILFFTKTANATVGAPVVVTADVPATAAWSMDTIKKALTSAALGSLLHASSYFMRRLAYDSATWIASGGKGQGALAFQDGAATYFSKLALDSSADLIDQLGDEFHLDLCSTPDLQLQVYLQIGLHSLYWGEPGAAGSGPSPSCTWQQMSNAWSAETFEEKYGAGGSKFLAESFSNALRFEDSDFGIALGAKAKIDKANASVVAGAAQDRTEGQGFKPLTTLIGGKIIDPSQTVKEESKIISSNQQGQMTATNIAGIYGTGFLEVIPMAAQVFLNTLAGQGMKTAQRELLNLFKEDNNGGSGDSTSEALLYESSGFQSSRKKAQQVFSDLLTVSIVQVDRYNLLEEFSACPSFPLNPSMNNCVIDSGLREAIEESSLGEPLTIADAISKGYLHGDWPLYSPKRVADTLDQNCYQRGYCYPNIQKLRLARILPLGFEIAAELADPDNPEANWTLDKVVKGFFDCTYDETDKTKVIYDSAKPYCHLIDPNWILKAPEARCNANVYSTNLSDNNKTGTRQQECVDVQTCIKEDDAGACNFFGYCTREKNVWRFNADSCESQYNTCTTFVSSAGDIDSYLSRTLDYGDCSLGSVGCRSYSTEKSGDNWLPSSSVFDEDLKQLGRNQTIFFNQNIENYTNDCSSAVVGCTEFFSAGESESGYVNLRDGSIYLQKAPDYLGCYDLDPCVDCVAERDSCIEACVVPENLVSCITHCSNSFDNCNSSYDPNCAEINRPETKVDLLALADRPEACNNYAQVCLPSEVGCDSYTPIDGPGSEVSIPGIIGNNYCESECVNYETFRQDKTPFEPGQFPLYFIPDEATQCNESFNGCDEFTNIDEMSRGGEALEYYSDIEYCERPTGDNEKTFYSWEGSQTEGYVLKLHKLRPIDQVDFDYLNSLNAQLNLAESINKVFPIGSPAYASDSVLSLQSDYDVCNQTNYYNLINNIPDNGDDYHFASYDCRALYDKSGEIYYRLLSDIISVSDECHPLRKTNSNLYIDNNVDNSVDCQNKHGIFGDVPDDGLDAEFCQRCYDGGFYEDGSCIYWAMSGVNESVSCPKAANGCRKYTGNSANNLQKEFLLKFDVSDEDDAINEAKDGWYPENEVSISAESIQVGNESLKVAGDIVYYEFDSSYLIKGDIFELSFWARGENQELKIYFEQDGQDGVDYFTINQENSIGIGSEWRHYLIGPVSLSNIPSDKLKLVFESDKLTGTSFYFLDNLQLNRVSDNYYRIKDSWKKAYDSKYGDDTIKDVPGSCDATPDDIYPGLALGCRQYEELSTGKTDIYATGFDMMCREAAIGCQAMYDSNNTTQSNTIIYNLWCEDDQYGGDDKKCEIFFDPGDGQGMVILGSCIVPTGESGCFVDEPINEEDYYYIPSVNTIVNGFDVDNLLYGVVNTSTVIIPGDSEEPVFLTKRNEFSCVEKNKGCQEVALEEKVMPNAQIATTGGYQFTPTFILNDPEHYDETLCRDDLVGCEQFTNNNQISYFKNPNLTGSSFCEYRDKVEVNGTPFKGWFLRDFGKCSINQNICKSDSDCPLYNEVCKNIGLIPCYDDYILVGGEYGLWSNNATDYEGMVGLCSSNVAGCSEIVDPQDTSSLYPNGYPYYLIINSKLTSLTGECEGQASLAEGCVLFNKTDEPNLLYDSAQTYLKSKEKDFALVSLVSNSNSILNDANRLFKVVPDRECAEWLSCRGYRETEDTLTGTGVKKVCQALMGCVEGNEVGCVQGLEKDVHDVAGKRLDLITYIGRNTDWQTQRDFSGYSLFNQYQIFDLDFFFTPKNNIDDEDDVIVGYEDKDWDTFCEVFSNKGKSCGDFDEGNCIDKKCVVPAKINNQESQDNTNILDNYYVQECRGYPEKDSPFADIKNSIVKTWVLGRPFFKVNVFEGSNVCQEGENCDCNYLRIGLGQNGEVQEERFYSLSTTSTLKDGNKGICLGGDSDGSICGEECGPGINMDCVKDCGDGIECIKPQKKNERWGWEGYCLERDYSTRVNGRTDFLDDAYACLTWLPLEKIPNAVDIFSENPDVVGYKPDEASGKYYCTEMMGVNDLTYQMISSVHYDTDGVIDGFTTNYISCDSFGGILNNSKIPAMFKNNDQIVCQENYPLNFTFVDSYGGATDINLPFSCFGNTELDFLYARSESNYCTQGGSEAQCAGVYSNSSDEPYACYVKEGDGRCLPGFLFNNSSNAEKYCKKLRTDYETPINIYNDEMTFKDVQDYVWSFINILQNANDYIKADIDPKVPYTGGLAVAYSDRVVVGADDPKENVYFNIKYQHSAYDFYNITIGDSIFLGEEMKNRVVTEMTVNPGKNYLARVDMGGYVVGPDIVAGNNNHWFSETEQNTSINLVNMIKETAYLPIVKNMATQGYNNSSYAPLFPDVKNIDVWKNQFTATGVAKTVKWLSQPHSGVKTLPSMGDQILYTDTGVMLHRPTLAESILNKNFIDFVSIIPLWPANGLSEAESFLAAHPDPFVDEVPKWGAALVIPVDDDFYDEMPLENLGDDAFNEAFRMVGSENGQGKYYKTSKQGQRSNGIDGLESVPADDFGRYWVFKEDYSDFDYFGQTISEVKGYTLVWMRLDKFNTEEEYSVASAGLPTGLARYTSGFLDKTVPFCTITDKKSLNYFIAVEVLFDADTGQFLGYKSRNCNGMSDWTDYWGFATAVSFHLKPICLETVEVFQDNPRKNKAQTNNLWKESQFNELTNISSVKKTYNGFPFGSMIGQVNLTDIINFQDVFSNDFVDDSAGVPLTCRVYSNKELGSDTLVFSGLCNRVYTDDTEGNFLGSGEFFDQDFAEVVPSSEFTRVTLKPRDFKQAYDYFNEEFNLLPKDLTSDWRYNDYVNKNDVSNYLYAGGDLTEKKLFVKKQSIINELFREVYGISRRLSFDSSNSVGYNYAELSNTWNNVSDFDPYRFGDKSWLLPNTPPTILFPLENPYNYFSYTENCADPNQGNCNFDTYKNSFKVENSFSNENFIYAKGYLTAKLSFFAWANDNQMPLREIKINWGDGNAIFGDNETGYYKNKKPICGDESGQINVLKLDNKEFGLCSVDDKDRGCAAVIENESFSSVTECFCKLGVEGPLFGNQKGLTCDEEPYVFVWNYNCEISQTQKDDYEDAKKEDNFIGYLKTINFIKVGDMKSGLPGDGVVITDTQFGLPEWYKFLTTQRGLSDDNFVCVYQPMVQVKDNWDWRNSGEHDTACNFADAWTRYNNILVVSP